MQRPAKSTLHLVQCAIVGAFQFNKQTGSRMAQDVSIKIVLLLALEIGVVTDIQHA
ncbi:hypothetical protein D3C85_1726330 [compost metagenome]